MRKTRDQLAPPELESERHETGRRHRHPLRSRKPRPPPEAAPPIFCTIWLEPLSTVSVAMLLRRLRLQRRTRCGKT